MHNIETYNARMAKSMIDKAYFLSFIHDSGVFVDYGCGDGTLLGFIKNNLDECTLVGFDNNVTQLEIAKERHPKINFTSNFNKTLDFNPDGNATLILSSVIHEVYSYSPEMTGEFWSDVFESNFKYIAIRDMSISAENANKNMRLEDIANIRKNAQFKYLLSEFEQKWGNINKGINYLHWLLKYHYADNWKRENSECYLPLTTEQLLEKIPDTYRIEYMSLYTLPWIRSRAQETFGIDLNLPSHIKLLLKRK